MEDRRWHAGTAGVPAPYGKAVLPRPTEAEGVAVRVVVTTIGTRSGPSSTSAGAALAVAAVRLPVRESGPPPSAGPKVTAAAGEAAEMADLALAQAVVLARYVAQGPAQTAKARRSTPAAAPVAICSTPRIGAEERAASSPGVVV